MPMKVLFVTSEAVPFAKTGGLADVSGALPLFLKKKKIDVRVCMPFYKKINFDKTKPVKVADKIVIPMLTQKEYAEVYKSSKQNVPFYFIKNSKYYDRDSLYSTSQGDYADNDERFIFFSRAVLEMCKAIDFKPDVIHCNDWQTALIPLYLKTLYSIDAYYNSTACVFSVHNVAYQGVFSTDVFNKAGFGWTDYTHEKLEYYGKVNFMKSALVTSQIITTVSERYSQEIQKSKDFGAGLEGVFASRKDRLFGILNGLDYEMWDPKKDSYISVNYDLKTVKDKIKCKMDLLKEVGLTYKKEVPVFGIVSRLDPQKGLDILSNIMDELLSMNVQFVLLGTGTEYFHKVLRDIAKKYPQKAAINIGFDEKLAHKIYAGSDFFLMPSKYEPCGLGQMISMTYGTCPIVHTTGGLADTVVPFDAKTGKGNGFRFDDYSSKALIQCIKEALKVFDSQVKYGKLVSNMMQTDFSWDKSTKKYIALYQKAVDMVKK